MQPVSHVGNRQSFYIYVALRDGNRNSYEYFLASNFKFLARYPFFFFFAREHYIYASLWEAETGQFHFL